MTEQEISTLGNYAENLMRQKHFNTLCDKFAADAFAAMMSTAQTDTQRREAIYGEVRGLQSFLGMLSNFVTQRDLMLKPSELEIDY